MRGKRGGVPHPIKGRGLNARIDHTRFCRCPLFLQGKDAPFVRWECETGIIRCFNCGHHEDMPLPCVRENWFSGNAYPDFDALAGDINGFLGKHAACLMDPAGTPKGPGLEFDPGPFVGQSKVRFR